MKRSPRSRSEAEFDELDRAFFEAAPPEVAVAPPAAARFDDLDAAVPARLRAARRRRDERAARNHARASAFVAWSGAAATAFARAAANASRSGVARARGWASARIARIRSAAAHGLPVAREIVGRRARATFTRLAAQIPGERPNGKTLAATIAVVIAIGLSAGVFAQRPAVSAAALVPAPPSAPIDH
jgi:hypothetical protein